MEKIVRYNNRKLYHPTTRSYVTYDTLSKWDSQGTAFVVTDHVTKNDLTTIIRARLTLHNATKDFYLQKRS